MNKVEKIFLEIGKIINNSLNNNWQECYVDIYFEENIINIYYKEKNCNNIFILDNNKEKIFKKFVEYNSIVEKIEKKKLKSIIFYLNSNGDIDLKFSYDENIILLKNERLIELGGQKKMIDILIEKGLEGAKKSYKVREKVFIEEQGVPEEIEKDEYDKEAVFANLYEDGEIKATARYIIKDGKCYIGRVAVLKEDRGRGFGDGILNVIIDEIFANNINEIWIHSQKSVIKFYERFGFKAEGDEYIEAGIPHITMKLIKKNRIF